MPGECQVDVNTILELTGLIYNSVADSSHWQAFLGSFIHAIGARRGALSIRDVNRAEFNIVCWYGWPDDLIKLYIERYAATDPWRIGAATRTPEGYVGTDCDACQREVMESSDAFREFYAPNDAIHGMGGTILASATGQSLFAAVRGAADGPFQERELAIPRALMPHLKRAALLSGELGSIRAQLASFTSHLDRYPYPFLLLDAERRVLYNNVAAREISTAYDGFAIEAGRFSITSPKLAQHFQRDVAELARARNKDVRRLQIHCPSRTRPYRLLLVPVPDSGVLPLGVALPSVAVVIIDSEAGPEVDPAILREIFSLTPAEARVAAKLVKGESVEEIAGKTGASIQTVRTHLKRILSKTETKRQGEIISLILRSAPFVFSHPTVEANGPRSQAS